MARAGAERSHTAMLGDKLLTDMLAANRAGVLALMVEPVGGAVTVQAVGGADGRDVTGDIVLRAAGEI